MSFLSALFFLSFHLATSSLLSNQLFWVGLSFFAAFAATYWLVLQKPVTFLILVVLFVALFALFGPYGAAGFLAAAAARLILNKRQAEPKPKGRRKAR